MIAVTGFAFRKLFFCEGLHMRAAAEELTVIQMALATHESNRRHTRWYRAMVAMAIVAGGSSLITFFEQGDTMYTLFEIIHLTS